MSDNLQFAAKQPNDIFAEYFWRWYDPRCRDRRKLPVVFPDMTRINKVPVRPEGYISEWNKADAERTSNDIHDFFLQAESDFERIIGILPSSRINSLEAIDRYFAEGTAMSILAESDPADDGNQYAVLCCEIGAYIGEKLIQENSKLVWWIDWPCWDSRIVHRETGTVASVFHWAIKLLSSDEDAVFPKAIWYLRESEAADRIAST